MKFIKVAFRLARRYLKCFYDGKQNTLVNAHKHTRTLTEKLTVIRRGREDGLTRHKNHVHIFQLKSSDSIEPFADIFTI